MNTYVQIQPIGDYFKNDKNGFVINPASWDNIPIKWHPVVEQIKQSYFNQLGDTLHSVYLRGSIVRGCLVDGLSDLDTFAIVKGNGKRWENAYWANALNTFLTKNYDFVSEVELMLSSVNDEIIFENPNVAMMIKTQSLCVFGDDLGNSIQNYKPDKSMMLNYRWVESDYLEFIEKNKVSNEELKNFIKVLIRAGFELVMEMEGKYTPDLFYCYKSFSKYFPEWKEAMEKALFYYLNPSDINEKMMQSILELGEWLVGKVKLRLL